LDPGSLGGGPAGAPSIQLALPKQVTAAGAAEIASIEGSTSLMDTVISAVSQSNFALRLGLSGSMASLFGMVRAMQLIVLCAMLKANFPANTQTFFLGASVIASMDVFEAEAHYERLFAFKETRPVNEKFDFVGTGDKAFTSNSGSFYVMLLLILLEELARRLTQRLTLCCPRRALARQIGAACHQRNAGAARQAT